MQNLVEKFIKHVKDASSNPDFIHHKWFVKYHLEIVDDISQEICDIYAKADRDFVKLLAWLHDYGKILDFDNQYALTLTAGRSKLLEIGFDTNIVDRAIAAIEIIDRKDWHELKNASIEIQIVSSADGASHHTGPFMSLWWLENPNKKFEQLMADTIAKSDKDWNRKIVLPEVREAFKKRRDYLLELSGELPKKYLS